MKVAEARMRVRNFSAYERALAGEREIAIATLPVAEPESDPA